MAPIIVGVEVNVLVAGWMVDVGTEVEASSEAVFVTLKVVVIFWGNNNATNTRDVNPKPNNNPMVRCLIFVLMVNYFKWNLYTS